MLIGIDMLGVQSPGAGDREAGRFGRQLVRALLARDRTNRYLLYTHSGLPTDQVPSHRNAERVTLGPAACASNPRRSSTRQLLDRNPDGLDWLMLLDPFDPACGSIPPESPLNGPRVASILHEFSSASGDDRALFPLSRHDALLAVSESVASEFRRRLGRADHRVSMIGLAADARFGPAEPITQVSAEELGRLGIRGPFLMTSPINDRSGGDLKFALDGYRRLPLGLRAGLQLVITGDIADSDSVRSFLKEAGAEEGLVLVGGVSEGLLATLHGRCSAFLDTSPSRGSGLALIEAMSCGTPVIAVHSPTREEILGESGILIRSTDPSALTGAIENLVQDPRIQDELRQRSLDRSREFSFDLVVDSVIAVLGENRGPTKSRHRFDRGHRARPRIAVFVDVPLDAELRVDLSAQIPSEWAEAYAIDLYFEPGRTSRIDGLPVAFGGFDARLFERNHAILGYHAVIHRIGSSSDLGAVLRHLSIRAGLVILDDEGWRDLLEVEDRDTGSDEGLVGLRAIFKTGSFVVTSSSDLVRRVTSALPEFAERLIESPAREPSESGPEPFEPSASTSLPVGLIDRSAEDWRGAVTRCRPVEDHRFRLGSPHFPGFAKSTRETAPRSR